MIQCPKCQAKLPDGAGYCQFCHATFAPVNPPRVDAEGSTGIAPQPGWIWPAYYAIAAWWILGGVYGVLSATLLSHASGGSGGSVLLLIVEALPALVGVGLVFKVELARGIVNIACFLQILQGCLGLLFAFFSPFVTGLWGIVTVLMEFLNIGSAILMIYLIGETETRGPNF
jgi:hypothetical protein